MNSQQEGTKRFFSRKLHYFYNRWQHG